MHLQAEIRGYKVNRSAGKGLNVMYGDDGIIGTIKTVTHVDTLIISVFELPNPLIMVFDHPIRSGTILHDPKYQLRYLTVPHQHCRLHTAIHTFKPDLPRFTYSTFDVISLGVINLQEREISGQDSTTYRSLCRVGSTLRVRWMVRCSGVYKITPKWRRVEVHAGLSGSDRTRGTGDGAEA
jgi:hypothetical protein